MKLGIIVDSSSGLSKDEANKKNWGFLPLYLYINNKEYADGVDMLAKDYYSTIDIEDKTRTSATPIGLAIKLFDKYSKEYDQVIVYGISTELSSQTSSLKILAKEYKNIHVINSKSVGPIIENDINYSIKMNEEGKSIKEIVSKLNELSKRTYGIVVPKVLDWLVKGGRVSKKIANIAKFAKIIPTIKLEDGKLEKLGKGRIFNKTCLKTFKSYMKEHPQEEYLIYHGMNPEIDYIVKELLAIKDSKISIHLFPPIIINHIGLGAVAIVGKKSK